MAQAHREYKVAIYIGRFQPFHKGHLAVLEHALALAEKVVVVIGSAYASRGVRNPFTLPERSEMVLKAAGDESHRVVCIGARDHFYSDEAWLASLQSGLAGLVNWGEATAVVGSYKDDSSYYLKMFPQWDFKPPKQSQFSNLNATDIRAEIFGKTGNKWEDLVPPAVRDLVKGHTARATLASVYEDYEAVTKYKAIWAGAPFPPTFNTVDAIVLCRENLLVVERGGSPGRGKLALPGGFVRHDERLRDAVVRELLEETGLRRMKSVLDESIVGSHVFDHPARSERGRTITFGYYFKLDSNPLPEVHPGDDAKKAFWMPWMDVLRNEERFFEDHISIVQHFLTKK
jgi:bifunctional NMN adenylyltransferase/nudix hydrolase